MSHAALVADLLFPIEKIEQPRQNVSTWQPSMVELIDGQQVRNDSEEWRAECEAITLHSWDSEKRANFWDMVRRHRGQSGVEAIQRMMVIVEPAYVLSLPAIDARRAYLAGVEKRASKIARQRLEEAVMALWERRKANTCNSPAA